MLLLLFLGDTVVKNLPANAGDSGDAGWIPLWGRSPGEVKWSEVAQLCPTLCDPVDCSPPGFVYGILQARILEWVSIPFSRGSSRPRDQTQFSCIAGRDFNLWVTREAWSPGEGNGNPLQYSCQGNPMNRGASELQSMESEWLSRHAMLVTYMINST